MFGNPYKKREHNIMNIRSVICFCILKVFSLFPVKKNKIVYMSFYGKYYNDNPKRIFLEINKDFPGYEHIWLLEDYKKEIDGAKVVRAHSILAIYHLATAKLWIDNCRKQSWLRKRKGQLYIQTWHANFSLKKGEKDSEHTLSKIYIQRAKQDSKMADYMLSGNSTSTQLYKSSFWFSKEVLEFGLPSAEIFYENTTNYVQVVKNYYNLKLDCKICLYVPTFRDDNSLEKYLDNYDGLRKSLTDKFGGEWKIILRLHPNVQYLQNKIVFDDNIINGSGYEDINELIVASNFVISDYSSCMFDALEAGVNTIIYVSDQVEYDNERGLYLNFSELPFNVARNEDELWCLIDEFDRNVYCTRRSEFMCKHGFFNKCGATKHLVEFITKEIEKLEENLCAK